MTEDRAERAERIIERGQQTVNSARVPERATEVPPPPPPAGGAPADQGSQNQK